MVYLFPDTLSKAVLGQQVEVLQLVLLHHLNLLTVLDQWDNLHVFECVCMWYSIMCVCVDLYVGRCARVCVGVYVYAHVYTCACMCICICICT